MARYILYTKSMYSTIDSPKYFLKRLSGESTRLSISSQHLIGNKANYYNGNWITKDAFCALNNASKNGNLNTVLVNQVLRDYPWPYR